MKRIALVAIALSAAAPALAGDIIGEWKRTDGRSRIRMANCGGAVCGTITWLRDPNSPARVGQQVFSGLTRTAEGWTGSAFNPEDGKTYDGKVILSGASMTTSGCAFGGMICKSAQWTRAN
ncbi:DUF2147 domain-containing protein [Rhodoblastus acidophilus]|uniref:DUF2147 domain-containing protein n=1 Tax=Rhodoblastus acidophilus TaxID=1074 RepID=A0A6N8DNW1_RHOAC|nr:DUF2147 domain-containing protein [Rhodoblastus acidophilus]MCW2274501.1 uncharacterized protein (DUF2147 family) [Rhodoblastus acidophilus]MTV32282.1 DUF2147 domain-containing protein [Rhodoblastus acidophilus]